MDKAQVLQWLIDGCGETVIGENDVTLEDFIVAFNAKYGVPLSRYKAERILEGHVKNKKMIKVRVVDRGKIKNAWRMADYRPAGRKKR